MATRRVAVAALAATAFLLSLASCTPEREKEAPDRSAVEVRTRLVAAMSWAQQPPDTRTTLCESIASFGPEWAADQVAAGFSFGEASDLDPDVSVQYVTERCVAEGLWPGWAND